MWSLSQNKILVEGEMIVNCKGDTSTIDNLVKLKGHIKGVEQVENLVGFCAACKGGMTQKLLEYLNGLTTCWYVMVVMVVIFTRFSHHIE